MMAISVKSGMQQRFYDLVDENGDFKIFFFYAFVVIHLTYNNNDEHYRWMVNPLIPTNW